MFEFSGEGKRMKGHAEMQNEDSCLKNEEESGRGTDFRVGGVN